MNQQALEAAAKAIAALGHTNPPSWNDYNPAEKSVLSAMARAALTAYAEACGERVVYNNSSAVAWGLPLTEWKAQGVPLTNPMIAPGEELVIRKVGTDGK